MEQVYAHQADHKENLMANFDSNQKKIQNNTQSGESEIFIGHRKSSELLPSIFKTETNTRFLQTTLDQLLSSGTTETLDTYWGRINGNNYLPGDLYAPELSAQRINHQLANGFVTVSGDESVSVNSYIDILNTLNQYGVDISNVDTLNESIGYTLTLPINIDMFINYVQYFWIPQDIPECTIVPTTIDPIDIDDIVKLGNYTTP